MSLSVTLDGQPFTQQATGLQIKNVFPGGFASVSFNVARRLDEALFAQFTDCRVYDSSTGEQVGGGRLMDQGRNDDGTWNVACLGEGLASMQDRTTPVMYVDSDLTSWRTVSRSSRQYSTSVSTIPDSTLETETLLFQATDGKAIGTNDQLTMAHRGPTLCDMNLASLSFVHRDGLTSSAWHIRSRAYLSDLTGASTGSDVAWDTPTSSRVVMTLADFTTPRQIAAIQWLRDASSTANDTTWSTVRLVAVRTQIYGANGSLNTTGYVGQDTYILPHEVAIDWVVRYCPRLTVAGGTVAATSTQQIDQMSYISGIHGMALMEDVAQFEPALGWAVWEQDATTGKWPFYYQPLPTSIRYEATTADGFSAPSPSTEIYNTVTVTGKTSSGRDVNVTRTQTVAALDAAGVTREATIELGAEVWSTAAAQKAGDTFLAEHAVAPNAGTITIARPILDNDTGRWVKPCNIRSGGLIRVRGIQPTPDTLNATSPDGVTVFRVVSATYDNDSGVATLELDEYELTETRAIANLSRARPRKR